ncbi:hypothetical protein ACFSJM_05470 [Lactococcus formosensis subsp. bovis]|uniref:hypothetical protein n=1 Tax=Lactococcus formosensis TaxID=1281486 RepID=UPI001BCA8666|nr:hypothetical protein [Lactococcus formosensis]
MTGKVESVEVEVLSTNHDKENFFTLIPIVISDGKTTTINYIPTWNQIEKISLKYKYEGKQYETKTDDFKIKEYSGKRYAKFALSDIGKQNAPFVLYTANN